jgi:hypothetical protein
MDHNNNKAVSRRLKLTLLNSIILVFLPVAAIFAQKGRDDTPPLRERLFYGGSFGLQLGTITDIQVSPVVGIWLMPRLAVAAGPDYRYYKDPNYRTDIYGGSCYMQFVFIQDLDKLIPLGMHLGFFIHVEDELLSLQSTFWKKPPYASERFFINTVLAGAGISQQMGRRSSLNFMFLWALNEKIDGLYSNPEIRVSFIF